MANLTTPAGDPYVDEFGIILTDDPIGGGGNNSTTLSVSVGSFSLAGITVNFTKTTAGGFFVHFRHKKV